MNLNNVSTNELMFYALANLEGVEDDGGYAVGHGSQPVKNFGQLRHGEPADHECQNPLTAAFPCLWPYGEGGIEADRPQKLSFM